MQEFTYTIQDSLGIHARPAGMLAKLAKSCAPTIVTLCKGDKSATAGQLMKVMGMGIKQGDEISVRVEGGSEAEAAATLENFFHETL